MRLRLELVRKRRQFRGLAAAAMCERLLEQPVGEPRVARQERAVQIRADRAAEPAAFMTALAVVAEAVDDPAERLRTRIETGAARVVLEAGERSRRAGLELALEEHVADHPPRACHCLERQEPDARHVLAVKAAVAATEQLVAAAHRKERGSARDNGLEQRLRLRREILRDEELLPVLAAADVVEVVYSGNDCVVHADRGYVEVMPAPGGAPGEDRDVAAVGVDVEVLGIEMADA